MSALKSHILWPRKGTPLIRIGGRFPMQAHNPEWIYRSNETVAIHMHFYAGRMWVGNKIVSLKPGDFTLTPVKMPSHYDLDISGHHVCVHCIKMHPGKNPLRLPLHWRPGPHERIVNDRLQEVVHLCRMGDGPGSNAMLAREAAAIALQSLLLWVAVIAGEKPNLCSLTPTRVDEVIEHVRDFLDQHYCSKVNVRDISQQVGISQNYLMQRFRIRYGISIKRYVLDRRIELARHLLTNTRMPIKAIAIEVGLGNPQYFHRQFHKVTGYSPSDERILVAARSLSPIHL